MHNRSIEYTVLSSEEHLLLGIVKIYAGTTAKESLSDIIPHVNEWNRLLDLADLHNIRPFVSSLLSDPDFIRYLPDSIQTSMKKDIYTAVRNHLIYRTWLAGVLSGFNEAGIIPMIIKGHTFADKYYDTPYLRTSVDLDILIKPDQIQNADNVLIGMGYKSDKLVSLLDIQNSDELHRSYVKGDDLDKKLIELHFKPVPGRLGYIDSNDIWNMASLIVIEGRSVFVPSETHQLVLLILHMIHHGWGSGSLRCLLDISLLIKKQTSIDWMLFCRQIRSLYCRGFAYHILKWVNDYICVQVPMNVLVELVPSPRESWCSNPPRKFRDVVALQNTVGMREKTHDLFSEIAEYSSLTDKYRFLTGVIFPPVDVVTQRLGIPSRWELYANLMARPVIMLWRIIRRIDKCRSKYV
ncbi:MAG: nucleotidyltransferase domain-containing protein [Armatimonadota bacterium]